MASPAAVLSVLVQAEGIQRTNSQLRGLNGGLANSSKAAGRMGDDIHKSAGKGSRALGALKSSAGLAVGALGVVGVAGAVKSMVSEFEEARKVGANTNQVIKSTGGVANVSAKHVGILSNAISKKAGIDDEAIASGANLLLTFKNIRNETGKGKDIFDQATKAAVDLSAAGFGSLSSTSKQLGKALNDPVKGMTALGRSGVTFSEDQKKAIEALLKTGKAADRVKAQQIILKEVQSQVGGQAAAQATTMDHLKVTLGNLAEAAGSVLVPALDKIGKFLNKVINQMIEGKGAGGAIVSVFKNVGGAIGTAVGIVKGATKFFKEHKTIAFALAGVIGVFALAYTASLIPALIASTAMVYAQVAAWVALKVAFLTSPIGLIVVAIAALVAGLIVAYQKSEAFRAIVDKVWSVIKTVATAVWNIAKVVLPAFVGGIVDAVKAVFDFITHLDEIPGKIVDAGKAIVHGIVEGIKALPGLLTDAAAWLWDKVKKGLEAYLAAYKAVGTWILNRIVDGFKVVTQLLASVGGWLLNRFTDFIKAQVAGVKAIGGWLLNRIVDGFKVVTDLLSTVGGWIKNRIVDFIKLEIGALKAVGSWIVNRVVDGFTTVTEALGKVGGWLKNRLVEIFAGVKDKIVGIGGTLIGWIVDGLKGGLNLLVGFVNKIIDVINKIPGVDIKHVAAIKLAQGGTTADKAQALAQGGIVRKPIVMMGEEAPRHPEYVIPTNPAYRDRAQMLLAQAAGAIGFSTGGVFDATSYGPPWTGINGTGVTATGVNLKGSPHVYGVAVDPSVIALNTLMKIWPNPFDYKGKFSAFDTGSAIKGRRLDFYDWRGRESQYGWGSRQVRVGEGAIGPSIGDIAGNVADALNPLDFIKKLPGIGDLPDWLKGTGRYILDKVGDYIKRTVSSIVPGGGTAKGPKGIGTFEGLPMANWVIGALKHARSKGFTGHPTSGYRSHAQNVAAGRNYFSEHEGTQYPHGAVDFGGFHSGLATKLAFVDAVKDYKYPLLAPIGFTDDGHASGTGHRMGGILGQGEPFVGSYRNGGRVPADGFGYLHRGEEVLRRDQRGPGGPLVHVEHMEVRNDMDLEVWTRKLGWQLATRGVG